MLVNVIKYFKGIKLCSKNKLKILEFLYFCEKNFKI